MKKVSIETKQLDDALAHMQWCVARIQGMLRENKLIDAHESLSGLRDIMGQNRKKWLGE